MTINPDEFDTVYDFDIPTHPWAIVTHTPTGTTAACNDTPCELLNRSKAIATLARQLEFGRVEMGVPMGRGRRMHRSFGRVEVWRAPVSW